MPVARKAVYLIGGDDEFAIKEHAAVLAQELAPPTAGEFGLETLDGWAGNADEAMRVLAKLDEAVNTIGFFGAEKLVWLKNTNLLAVEPPGGAATTDALNDLADRLKPGLPAGVTLLVSAVGVDKRRRLFTTLSKLGEVAWFDAPEAGKADGEEVITEFIEQQLAAADKRFVDGALPALRELVEPTRRALAGELEKLFLYVGARRDITADDVRTICSATRQAIVWELVDAIGARHLPRALVALENLLGHGEQPIGVLALLASQFRLMILARDLADRKVLTVDAGDRYAYANAFKKLPAVATAHIPRGKEGQLPNEWRMQRCAVAAQRFTAAELVRGLATLLNAHLQLVSTQLDERLVLAEALAHIAGAPRRQSR